jgi:hypothetical protein
LISWRWSRPFTWDTWKGTKFFICLRWARRARSRIFLYTLEHGMNIGSLRMSDLRRCCMKIQTWCTSWTKCYLCGIRTTASRFKCHTLADCIIMIHHGTYLQILFCSRLLKGLSNCS